MDNEDYYESDFAYDEIELSFGPEYRLYKEYGWPENITELVEKLLKELNND